MSEMNRISLSNMRAKRRYWKTQPCATFARFLASAARILVVAAGQCVFSSPAHGAGPSAELPSAALSNVLSIANTAEEQLGASNFVQSMELFTEAQGQLAELIRAGAVNPDETWKYMLSWREMNEMLQPLARRDKYMQTRVSYLAYRKAFLAALCDNDIRVMNVSLNEADRQFAELAEIYAGNKPAGLPGVPPPRDMRTAYSSALYMFRTNWLSTSHFTMEQRHVIQQLTAATSITVHTHWIDTARTSAQAGVTLPWLEDTYKDLTMQEPCVYAFWYGLGNCSMLLGKTREANKAWHNALRYFPDSLYLHYHLARTCGSSREEAMRAVSHLRWLVEHAKDRVWCIKAHHQLALRLLELSDLQAANTHAKEAAKLAGMDLTEATSPLYSAAKRTQCTALLRLGRTEDAVAALEGASYASPDNVALKIEVADLLSSLAAATDKMDMKQAREALMWYDKAIREDPKCPTAHASKAYLYLLMGDAESAQGEALQELSVNPCSASALSTLGFTHLAQGNPEAARLLFRKALDIDPECAAAEEGIEKIDAAPRAGNEVME